MRIKRRSAAAVTALATAAALFVAGCGDSVSEDIENLEGGEEPGVEEDVGEELPEG